MQGLSSARIGTERSGRLVRSGGKIATVAGVSRMDCEAAPTSVAQNNCPVIECMVVKMVFSTSKGYGCAPRVL